MLARRILRLVVVAVLACASGGLCAGTSQAAPDGWPRIAKAPKKTTTSTDAHFRLQIRGRGAQVACRRDALRYRRCGTRVTYRGLAAGRHTFVVRARRGAGVRYVRHSWTVKRRAKAARRPAVAPSQARPLASGGPLPPPATPDLVFAEDFDGTSVNRDDWLLYDGPGHAGSGLRRPSAFSVDGRGNLVLTASMRDGVLVSGGMAHRVDQTYGRYVFRVRVEADPTGSMSANVLTWPQRQLAPEFTEIDMFETGWYANNTYRFNTFVHFGPENSQRWFTHDDDPSRWHTIEMDWRPDRLTIHRNGVHAWTTTERKVIPDVAHHLCIQLDAAAGARLAGPVRMFVDWVRIYR